MKRKTKKNIKQWVALAIMILSTSVVVFNNVGQSIQLIQVSLTRNQMYAIAIFSFAIGAVWISYLNKLLK